jgi:hypothetical protein
MSYYSSGGIGWLVPFEVFSDVGWKKASCLKKVRMCKHPLPELPDAKFCHICGSALYKDQWDYLDPNLARSLDGVYEDFELEGVKGYVISPYEESYILFGTLLEDTEDREPIQSIDFENVPDPDTFKALKARMEEWGIWDQGTFGFHNILVSSF